MAWISPRVTSVEDHEPDPEAVTETVLPTRCSGATRGLSFVFVYLGYLSSAVEHCLDPVCVRDPTTQKMSPREGSAVRGIQSIRSLGSLSSEAIRGTTVIM